MYLEVRFILVVMPLIAVLGKMNMTKIISLGWILNRDVKAIAFGICKNES